MKLKGILCISHYYKLSMETIAQLFSVLNVFTILGLVLFHITHTSFRSTIRKGQAELEAMPQQGQD